MIYLIITFVIILISIPIKFLGKRHFFSKFCLFNIISILSIFSGIRYYVGTDFFTYNNIFQNIFTGGAPDGIEPLFYLMTATIRSFTDSSEVFFIITSIIINMTIVITLYKKSSDFTFSLFLYISMGFYFTSFNIVRQFIAMGIAFYIINNSEKFKKQSLIIGTIIAVGFHQTSIVIISLIFFKKNINIRKYIQVFTVIAIAFFVLEPKITNILTSTIYDNYENSFLFSYGSNIIYVIEYLGLCLIYYFYSNNFKGENRFFVMAVSIGIIFVVLGIKGVLYNRIGIFFNMYNMILLPNVINSIDNVKEKRLVKYGLWAVFLLRFSIGLSEVQPYYTNIQNIFYKIN